MKKSVSYLFIFLAMAGLISCNNNGFKKTKSGLLYKIISDGKGETAKRGQFIKFNYVQKVHDSILFTTDGLPLPGYAKVDSVGPIYSVMEIFPLLRKGDSVVVVQLPDSIEKKYHQQLPPYIRKKDKLVLSLRVLDILFSDSMVVKDREALTDIEKQKELASFQDYFKKNNITGVQQTPKGNYYVLQVHGTGPKADTGKAVYLKYSGSDMAGQYFDSNVDSTRQVQRHPLGPFSVVIGRGGAIPGMLDVVGLLREGDEGKMFIPGVNGYGQQGAGGVIKPFENLIFEVHVDSVREAPKQMPRMMRPNLPLKNGKPQLPPVRH
jgi:FKBP-type peptidyl-prolyl cis-trans isomerase FkpA